MLTIDKIQLDLLINSDPQRLKLAELSKQASDLKKEIKSTKDEFEKATKMDSLKSLEKQMEDIRHEIGLDGLTMKELGQRSKELKFILANLAPDSDTFKSYKKELDDVTARQKELKGATEQSGGAFSHLKEIFTGVGLVELGKKGIELFKENFHEMVESTKTSGDQYNFAVAGMQSGLQYFYKTMVSGDWHNFIDNLSEAIAVGYQYAEMMDQVKEKTIALSINEAAEHAKNVQLEEDMRDRTKSLTERLEAGKARIENEKKMVKERVDVAQQEYDAQLLQLKSRTKLSEDEIKDIITFNSEKERLAGEDYNKLLEKRNTYEKAMQSLNAMAMSSGVAVPVTNDAEVAKLKAMDAELASYNPKIVAYAENLKKFGLGSDVMIEDYAKSLVKLTDAAVSGKENLKKINAMNSKNEVALRKETLDTELNQSANYYTQLEAKEKKRYADGQSSNAQFAMQMDIINQSRLRSEAAIYAKNKENFVNDKTQYSDIEKKITDINGKLLDFKVKQQEYINTILQSATSVIDIENQEYNDRLQKAGLFNIDQTNLTKEQKATLEILEASHAANLNKIAYDAAAKNQKDLESNAQDVIQMDIESGQQLIDARTDQYKQDLINAGNNLTARKDIEQKYNEDILTMKMGQLQTTLQIEKAFGLSTVATEKEIDALKVSITKDTVKQQDDLIKEYELTVKEYNLKSLVEQENDEIAALNAKHDAFKGNEDKFQAALLAIKLKYAQQYVQKYVTLLNTMSNIETGLQDVAITNNTTKYQKDLNDLEENHKKGIVSDTEYNKTKTEIATKQEEEEKSIKKKYADIDFAVKIAQILANTAVAIMAGYAQLGPIGGTVSAVLLGVLGGVEVAQANAQRQQVKALKTGGFTDTDSSNDKPVGIVHANEFVANADGVSNPTVKPVLDIIDIAQRSGTIHTINLPAILAAQNVNRGFANGGYTSSQTGSGSQGIPGRNNGNDQFLILLSAHTAALNKFNDHLDKGIKTDFNMHTFETIVKPRWEAQQADVTKS